MASAAPPQVDGSSLVDDDTPRLSPAALAPGAHDDDRAHPFHHRGVATLALAVVAAAAAVAVNRWLFPLYSANRDDQVYVAMARVLERGHATLPAADWPFRPWATGLVDDTIVFKYAPPWPALLAVGGLLGSHLIGLAASAAAAVVAVRALANEVVRDRTTSFVAALLLVLSPLFLVQSGTYLPYLFSLALGAGAAVLLLQGVRVGSTARIAIGAALAGVAVFARPFDATLLLVPAGVAALATRQRACSRRAATAAMAIGAAPVLLLDLTYNWVVLGSPTKLPFGVTGSADAFGFGRRGVFESSTLPFDFGDGLSGAGVSLQWLPSWVAGGVVLVTLALWGMVALLRRGEGPARWVVASWVLVVPAGYLFFWGPWAMTHNWDGVQAFGPFYHLPLLVPAVVFGAHGLRMLAARSTAATAVAVAAMVALTAWSIPDKVEINQRTTDELRAVEQAVERAELDDAILFLPLRGDVGFLSITPFLENDPGLDGAVLYAEDCGTFANRAVLAQHPGRSGYRLEVIDDDRPTRVDSYVIRPIEDDPAARRVSCVK